MPIEFVELNDGTKFPVSPAYKSTTSGEPITYENCRATSAPDFDSAGTTYKGPYYSYDGSTYTELSTEPSNWSTNYFDYFVFDDPNYLRVTGVVTTDTFDVTVEAPTGGTPTTFFTYYKVPDIPYLTETQLKELSANIHVHFDTTAGGDMDVSSYSTGATSANDFISYLLSRNDSLGVDVETDPATEFVGNMTILDLIPAVGPLFLVSVSSEQIGSSYSQVFTSSTAGSVTLTMDLTNATEGLYIANGLQPMSSAAQNLFLDLLSRSVFDVSITKYNLDKYYLGTKIPTVIFGQMFPVDQLVSGTAYELIPLFSNIKDTLRYAVTNNLPLYVVISAYNGISQSTLTTTNTRVNSSTAMVECTWRFEANDTTIEFSYNIVTNELTGQQVTQGE